MNYKLNSKLTPLAQTLRKNMTKEERKLWYQFLRNHPIRFLKQKVIDNYIADFYCSKAKLIIELDGSQHYRENEILKDKIRTEKLEKRDLLVIRIPNNAVNNNFEGVCTYINAVIKNKKL
jgi:very-short-patch-repair endonuclease